MIEFPFIDPISTEPDAAARAVESSHVPTLRSVDVPAVAAVKATNPKDAAATTRIPLWLLSPIAKAHWALAQFAGMIKYGAWNWRIAGVRSSVYLSAALRHLDAYASGEEIDPIDGTDHRANVMACMAILIDAEASGKLVDDRAPSVCVRGTYGRLEELGKKLLAQNADKKPRHFTIEDTNVPQEEVIDLLQERKQT